jgi:pimeloyl-ACP methyl ester carboxylesterase
MRRDFSFCDRVLRWAGPCCVLALAVLLPGPAAALTPCHLPGMAEAVMCGGIDRPLATASAQQITVNFAVVPAQARGKRSDPVYFLAGGPGQSALAVLPAVLPALQRLNNRRDLVFVDQRGTGSSAPLQCPPEHRLPLAESLEPTRLPARMQRCRTTLEALPYGDLRQFTTAAAVADLDAVRAALGHERVNLIGTSYGTRVALEYQRRYPQRVRRAILDGVVPPDVAVAGLLAEDADAALVALLDDCATDAGCVAAHPRLRAHWQALLDAPARRVVVRNPLTGVAESLEVNADLLMSLVRMTLYLPSIAAGLPSAIDEAYASNWESLLGLASVIAGTPGPGIALGMHFSVLCSEDATVAAGTPRNAFASSLARSYAEVCRDWPRGDVPPDFHTLSRSPTAVLLFSGGRDPVTPIRHGERVAQALGPLARHVTVEHAGHGIMAIGCASDLAFQFLNAETDAEALAIDTTCLAGIPAAKPFQPARWRQGRPP